MRKRIGIGGFSVSAPLILGIAVLAAGSLMNLAASDLIARLYPDRPVVPDLLFDALPHVPELQYAFDALVAASIAIFLYYLVAAERTRSGYFLFTLGIGYLLRALLALLTPLGKPTGNDSTVGIWLLLGIYHNCMFPSGHTYLTAVIFLMIDRRLTPRLKLAAGLLCIAEMVCLLLARIHYSIDLAGGLMLALLTAHAMSRFKDRFEAPAAGGARASRGAAVRARHRSRAPIRRISS